MQVTPTNQQGPTPKPSNIKDRSQNNNREKKGNQRNKDNSGSRGKDIRGHIIFIKKEQKIIKKGNSDEKCALGIKYMIALNG